MQTTYPGTTVETVSLGKGSSQTLFDGIFATGGITLSQVSVMTGLEPYMIQNWVKRGFVSSPEKRMYSRDQFARIVIINMLRDSLQIDRICSLIGIITGDPEDASDDLISDEELYHRFVNMVADSSLNPADSSSVRSVAENAAADFVERSANAKKQLVRILEVMLYARAASAYREKASELMSALQ